MRKIEHGIDNEAQHFGVMASIFSCVSVGMVNKSLYKPASGGEVRRGGETFFVSCLFPYPWVAFCKFVASRLLLGRRDEESRTNSDGVQYLTIK